MRLRRHRWVGRVVQRDLEHSPSGGISAHEHFLQDVVICRLEPQGVDDIRPVQPDRAGPVVHAKTQAASKDGVQHAAAGTARRRHVDPAAVHVPRCHDDFGVMPPRPEIGEKGHGARKVGINGDDVLAARLTQSPAEVAAKVLRIIRDRDDFAGNPERIRFRAQLSQKGRRVANACEAGDHDGQLRFR